MTKVVDKPVVTVSGKKSLFRDSLHRRIVQDLPEVGVEWRRRLDSNAKVVYIDVDFVDFDIDQVGRTSELLTRLNITQDGQSESHDSVSVYNTERKSPSSSEDPDNQGIVRIYSEDKPASSSATEDTPRVIFKKDQDEEQDGIQDQYEVSSAFFHQKLMGRPILHTYWADKSDFESENQKSQFDEWIGQVQASTCTEWAIIIIEDGDFKAQIGTALFKSKLQSSTSQANISSSSISSLAQNSSFLDRMKKSLSTIFHSDLNSDRWLTLINQDKNQKDTKTQESYAIFMKKFRNVIMASFSKQIELFEEQLRVQREMRINQDWDFFVYFSIQEELALAFEFLTLFDEALIQYNLLEALFTEHISSTNFKHEQEVLYKKWTDFSCWPPLCLDLNNEYSQQLRQRLVKKEASLLEFRNYLFAKRCDLMLMQNEPWRVAASANSFINSCIEEHINLGITMPPGAMKCWSFVSCLEVLQKCECYSCTSTMENYSLHTVDIWNNARENLTNLGKMLNRIPGRKFDLLNDAKMIDTLTAGLGPDPHNGTSYQGNEISPIGRLKDALSGEEQFAKHLVEMSELTLGTYKHIGRRRSALLVGKQLSDFYIAQDQPQRALPFLVDIERQLKAERWDILVNDIQLLVSACNDMISRLGGEVSNQKDHTDDGDKRSEQHHG